MWNKTQSNLVLQINILYSACLKTLKIHWCTRNVFVRNCLFGFEIRSGVADVCIVVSRLIHVISFSWYPCWFLRPRCCSSLFLLADLHWPWTWLGGWARNEFLWRENAHDPLRNEKSGQHGIHQNQQILLSLPISVLTKKRIWRYHS